MLHLPPRYQRPTGVNAPADFADYKTTSLRHPKQPLLPIPDTLSDVTGPALGSDRVGELDFDLTAGFDVTVTDVSEAYGVLALQGPRSREILSRLTPDVAGVPFFGMAETTIKGLTSPSALEMSTTSTRLWRSHQPQKLSESTATT